MKNIEDVTKIISEVGHPAINYSLYELGIVADIKLTDNEVSVVFVFPFPNIPIADSLIASVANPVKEEGFDFKHEVRIMTDEERAKFMQMEQQGWKG